MVQETKRSGQCSCGAVRYEISGDPIRVTVCHCKECQRRTGSAFGVSCYFPKVKIKVLQGSMNTYERVSDGGRSLTYQFCKKCGTTVVWQAELLPQAMGVSGGTFDDTDWLKPERHVWANSAQGWIQFPEGAEVLQHGVDVQHYRNSD
jgi:hypothetical protein